MEMERVKPTKKLKLEKSFNGVQIKNTFKTSNHSSSSSSSSIMIKPCSKTTNNGVFIRSKENKYGTKARKGPGSKISSHRLNKGSHSGKPSINLNFVEKFTTPVVSKVDLSVNSNKNVEENSITKVSTNNVRTPPIEASVSPEIQFGSHSKILVSNSDATPVCYGAGHLLSGVTDKRKCRRRGSLKGGFSDKTNLLYSDENVSVSSNLKDSSAFPLLAEASVNWHWSPSDQRDEVEGNNLGTNICLDSDKTDLVSSLSPFVCVDVSDYLMIDYYGNGNACIEDGAESAMGEVSSTTPIRYSFCDSLSGSFSSGNKIQTPDSDSCSDRCVGTTKIEMDRRNFVPCELGSMSPTPNKEVPWLMWDAPGFGSDFASPSSSSIPIPKPEMNEDVAVSYATTLDNFSVSQMKISWRDELLVGGVIETNEEFDCCRCLSDEDDIGVEVCEKQPKTKEKYDAANENDRDVEDEDISQPKVLDYEPIISSKDKEKLASCMRDTCAESICTNGESLVDSADSDWTDGFSNNFIQV